MKMFFEMEQLASEEELLTTQPQFIRIALESESDADKYLKQFEPIFAGMKYVARIHYCRHDEGKECSIKVLKKVE